MYMWMMHVNVFKKIEVKAHVVRENANLSKEDGDVREVIRCPCLSGCSQGCLPKADLIRHCDGAVAPQRSAHCQRSKKEQQLLEREAAQRLVLAAATPP